MKSKYKFIFVRRPQKVAFGYDKSIINRAKIFKGFRYVSSSSRYNNRGRRSFARRIAENAALRSGERENLLRDKPINFFFADQKRFGAPFAIAFLLFFMLFCGFVIEPKTLFY